MRSFIHVATPPPLSEGHQGWYHLLSVNEQGGTVLFTRSDCMAATTSDECTTYYGHNHDEVLV